MKKNDRLILRTCKARASNKESNFDVDEMLFKNRQIFLYDDIDSDSAKDICTKIISLDISETAPITLWIHSDGGCVHSALAIISTMKKAKSPIITIINNVACSASAIISICGDKRYAFDNSSWMQHPTSEMFDDYIQFTKDRMRFGDKMEKLINEIHLECTKLTQRDVDKYNHGELWILGKQLVRKGIVDEILEYGNEV